MTQYANRMNTLAMVISELHKIPTHTLIQNPMDMRAAALSQKEILTKFRERTGITYDAAWKFVRDSIPYKAVKVTEEQAQQIKRAAESYDGTQQLGIVNSMEILTKLPRAIIFREVKKYMKSSSVPRDLNKLHDLGKKDVVEKDSESDEKVLELLKKLGV